MTDRDRSQVDLAFDRTARRYHDASRFTRHYVASKLLRDPVHAELLRRAGVDGFGVVADLGCGRGQIGILMLEAGVATQVIGFDRAGPALNAARAAASGLPYVALAQDLTAGPVATPCDTALLIDVLYQMKPAAAVRLLTDTAATIRRRVLVRTLDPDLGWRSALAQCLERVARLGWPTSGRHVLPLPVPILRGVLEAAGFAVEVSASWQGTPFANVLLDARRLAGPNAV